MCPSGKSTAVSLLTRRLQSLGFQILIVPEAATLLFTGGARYDGSSLLTELAFETNKIRVQMGLEDAFMELAKVSLKPTVIICDRGTMDSRAYIGGERNEKRGGKKKKIGRGFFLRFSFSGEISRDVAAEPMDRPAGDKYSFSFSPFFLSFFFFFSPQLRDQRYDAVFHLVTTAIGAEQFYSNASNATRLEDARTAR